MPTALPRSFLTLEFSLLRRLNQRWQEEVAQPIIKQIDAALREDDFADAERLIDRELAFDVLEEEQGYVEMMALSAFVLGQGFIAGATTHGQLARGKMEVPDHVEIVARSMLGGIQLHGAEEVRAKARRVVAQAERLAAGEPPEQVFKAVEVLVQKVADPALAARLNAAVASGGKRVLEAGANLTTSRLSTYGALSEANARGITVFQLNEVLDERTCGLCRRMHGRTFQVGPPLARMDSLLRITDPMELKTAAPFPSQSKAGLASLDGMTPGQMQENGIDVPPFHPYCRGVLARKGTVPASQLWTPSDVTAVRTVAGRRVRPRVTPEEEPVTVLEPKKPAEQDFKIPEPPESFVFPEEFT